VECFRLGRPGVANLGRTAVPQAFADSWQVCCGTFPKNEEFARRATILINVPQKLQRRTPYRPHRLEGARCEEAHSGRDQPLYEAD
jgi:hypothetical protein